MPIPGPDARSEGRVYSHEPGTAQGRQRRPGYRTRNRWPRQSECCRNSATERCAAVMSSAANATRTCSPASCCATLRVPGPRWSALVHPWRLLACPRGSDRRHASRPFHCRSVPGSSRPCCRSASLCNWSRSSAIAWSRVSRPACTCCSRYSAPPRTVSTRDCSLSTRSSIIRWCSCAALIPLTATNANADSPISMANLVGSRMRERLSHPYRTPCGSAMLQPLFANRRGDRGARLHDYLRMGGRGG
jgi:hypothetical protein